MNHFLIFILLLQTLFKDYISRRYSINNNFSNTLPGIVASIIRAPFCLLFYKKNSINKTLIVRAAILAFIYELAGMLVWKGSKQLTPIVFTICYQPHLIFVTILGAALLKRKYETVQITGLVLICFGLLLQSYYSPKKENCTNNIINCASVFLSGFFSALGAVIFEKYLKKHVKCFYSYMFIYSLLAIPISLSFLVFERQITTDLDLVGSLKSKYLYINGVIFSILTLLVSYIATKMCPVTRLFYFQAIRVISSITIQKILEKERGEEFKFEKSSIYALVLVNIGVLVYDIKNIMTIYKRISHRLTKKGKCENVDLNTTGKISI